MPRKIQIPSNTNYPEKNQIQLGLTMKLMKKLAKTNQNLWTPKAEVIDHHLMDQEEEDLYYLML
jgi:hypothetical protein